MGQSNRHRHQLRRFVAGKSEHQSLIAGPLLFVESLAFGDPLGDIGGLFIQRDHHRAGLIIETIRSIGIADLFDGIPDDFRDVNGGLRRNLSGD